MQPCMPPIGQHGTHINCLLTVKLEHIDLLNEAYLVTLHVPLRKVVVSNMVSMSFLFTIRPRVTASVSL